MSVSRPADTGTVTFGSARGRAASSGSGPGRCGRCRQGRGGSSRTGRARRGLREQREVVALGERTRSSISAGTCSWCGGTKSASCGPNEVPPIQTCSSRQRPAISGCSRPHQGACIARIASASSRSARSSAARHRRDVADDLGGVALLGAAELGQRDRLGAGRQVLDHRRRGGLGAEQHGRKRGHVGAQLSVEACDLGRRLLARREHRRGEGQGPVSNARHDGRAVGAGMATAHTRRYQIGRDPRRPRPNFRPESGPVGRRRHAPNITSISR